MTIQEALKVINQVVEQNFRGLPPDQRIVQEALQVVINATMQDNTAKAAKKPEQSDGNK